MATIYDIAKQMGVSPATVSKALSGAHDVSAQTRDRVLKTAREMDYIPDGRARGLSQKQAWTISVICQDESSMGLRHYLFSSIIESFKRVVESHGYDLIFISNKIGKMALSYYGHCRYRKVDGVFLVFTDFNSANTIELIQSDIPRIAIDYSNDLIGCITTDWDKSMALLYNHLYDLGHRDIVYIHGEDVFITKVRIEGLRRAMAARGMTLKSENLVPSKYYSIQGGYTSMQTVLSRNKRPTAVIASDDYSAIGTIKAGHEAGISFPNDISIVGFDGIELTQLFTPKLTTIRQDTDALGRVAAERLIAQIEGNESIKKTENTVLEPQLWVGDSCKRI